MKLLIGVVVLFGALTLQVLYTEGGLVGGDVDTLKEKLDQLQGTMTNELGLLRGELHGLKLKLRKKSKLMIKLKSLRENNEIDLRELKTVVRQNAEKISALQIYTARLSENNQSLCQCSTINGQIAGVKCDPCMPGLPEQEGETDRCGENGTRPERVSVPELRFTRAYGSTREHVVIEAGGAAVSDGPERAAGTTVRTDGLFRADHRVYWETRLVWSPVSVPRSGWLSVGTVGVWREGSDFGGLPGWDDQSWVVRIQYHQGQKRWRYDCTHGGKLLFQSARVTVTSPSVSHRLGLLLDPGAGTLTAVDVNTDSPIYTFSLPAGDAGSQPLVPLVRFEWDFFERRFSLPGVDPSRLPGAVTDLLQN